MKRNHLALISILIGGVCLGCGRGPLKSYVKTEAPWGVIQRYAILPFNLPSENPVERQLVTQLFSQELRRAGGTLEVTEVPLESPAATAGIDLKRIGSEYSVDAVFSGAVDDTRGTVVHIRLQDVATQEVLWSGSYTLGGRAEFLSFSTGQQKLQIAFEHLVQEFARRPGAPASS